MNCLILRNICDSIGVEHTIRKSHYTLTDVLPDVVISGVPHGRGA
jgi:hypothetical protein